MVQETYILEGLCCTNCAGKILSQVKKLSEVTEAELDFEAKKLCVTAEHCILGKVQEIADSVEEGIHVIEEEEEEHEPHHHDHGEECCCGHDHHHEHEHEHHHHHEHGEECCCGHDHHHEHEHHEHEVNQIYIMEGLCCANCAAKIEAKVNKLPDVEEAVLVFATKQLRVKAKGEEDLREKIQAVADSIEDGVTVSENVKKPAAGQIYIMEGLCCANCAAKIEAKVRALPEVDDATLVFATKQLRVSSKAGDLTSVIQAVADSIEDGVTVTARSTRTPAAEKKEEGAAEEKKDLICIIAGAVLFAIGTVLEHMEGVPFGLMLGILIAAYLILGGSVLLTAGKNIMKGQVFDENFLMSIATLGAFGIQEYPEAVGVMLFYRIGEFFEQRAVNKSRMQIMDAIDLRPEVVNLVSGEDIKVIPAAEAAAGAILLVRPGDRIPLDGIIVEGESRIDTSPITGEPVPVKAGTGDQVISGCVNTSGQLKIRVEKPLEESMVTRILDSVENAAANKPEIDRFITKFARYYTPIVVGAAVVVAFILPLILPGWHFFVDHDYTGTIDVIHGNEGTASIFTALTFLVISCPCALVLSVPLAFFSGIGAASKKNILFKGGVSIEALAQVKSVVMDKTGTVTKGEFKVQKAVSVMGRMPDDLLLAVTAGCELSSTHPIGVSIVSAAKELRLDIERPSSVKEIAGHGIEATMSLGTVLCGNRKLMDQYGVDMSSYENDEFGTEVFTAINGIFAGYIVIADTIKEDAVTAIAKTKAMGIITAMLTGDAKAAAENVAKTAGIDEVHAKLLPEDKVHRLSEIRERNGSVMFVGDGINDAPVLAGADVGAAMGSGADAAIEAADVVFMTSEMESIPEAICIAKSTRRISWQNVYFALAVKALVMVLGLLGFANMWLAVFADTGVALLCLLNSVRLLRMK